MNYLDASVVVPLIIAETSSEQMYAWLERESDICLSQWTISEVSSALSHHFRTGRIDAEEREAAEAALNQTVQDFQLADIDDDDVIAARALLRLDTTLRAPDALHLAIVGRLDCTLATYDRRLAASARAIGMAVVSP